MAASRQFRELSGANVNVGSDLLPGSTERCVSVNGGKDAVTQAGGTSSKPHNPHPGNPNTGPN